MVAFALGPEWIVVLVIIVLLFGAKKLPELARSVGKSTTEFKKGMSEGSTEADAGDPSDEAEKRPETKPGSTE